ncbi:MAG: PSD1 domain-containing protein [Planctomycetaceae bacterium]|nr:PSD1 domain-containing protein [Planctomycetaceae bacterium]
MIRPFIFGQTGQLTCGSFATVRFPATRSFPVPRLLVVILVATVLDAANGRDSAFAAAVGHNPQVQAVDDPVTFNRDVRTILSAACFRCHGQDAEHRAADLRLDQAEGAVGSVEDGAAFVPGDVAGSQAWLRMTSDDPDLVMPPPSANRQLTDDEKETLRRWIEQGAKYERHWAFEPIQPSPELLEQTEKRLPRNWIDAALDREAAKRKLALNGPTDARTLARRVAFALTGLPPQYQDVERFAQNPTQAAYEAYVDQLLASPQYGEEMARHWLDVARYGDTHGLHLDNDRLIWPYRDWVVQAFNSNQSFDQFTIEQVAGDLLPDPSQSQLVATGFNRCNVTTAEGGAIDDEFRFRYAVDRTSTTVQAFLGLTAGCAVCHDHKYDPLSMKEFYSLYAFYYSNADPAMDGNISTTAPFLKLPTPTQAAELETLRQRIDGAQVKLLELASQWSAQAPATANLSRTVTHVWLDDELPLGASQRNTTRNGDRWSLDEVKSPMGQRALVTEFGDKMEQVITGGLLPRWILENGQLQVWAQLDRMEPPQAIFLEIQTDAGSRRWVWGDSPDSARLVDAGADRIVGTLPTPGQWQLLTIPVGDLAVGTKVNEIKFGLFGGICYWDGLTISGKQRDVDNLRTDWRAWWAGHGNKPAPLARPELGKAIQEGPSGGDAKNFEAEVKAYFHAMIDSDAPPALQQARAELESLRVQRQILEDRIPGTMIYRDANAPRQAHVMTRGQYDAPGEAVQPGGLAALPPMPSRDSRTLNRLDLARWMVSSDQPLTPRVTVNRFWQQVFGVGLVKTSDDFGTQGTPPTHPQLLDDLAYHFAHHGWNVKELLKELVMTQAFQRSAVVTAEAMNLDPENRYLARGPRIRLDAEQIRDNALAVSGLLQLQLGGPGFRAYQPPNIWEPVGYGDSNTRYYIQQHGEQLYRRSLYTYFKRTAPPPFMSNWDAPNRETFCTRRERSNTPLQALQLMNDVQHVEAARCLAERLLREGAMDDQARVTRLFEWVLARQPDAYESEQVLAFLLQSRSRLAESPTDAQQIATIGERWRDANLPIEDVATWTLVSNLILNLDETVTRN